MKLVIDIPKEDYEKLMNGEGSINLFLTLCAVVFNGIPLKDLECADCMKECAESRK